MSERSNKKKKPNPEKVAFLRSLPLEIKEQITGEEAEALIYDDELPASLEDKLKNFLVDEE